MSERIVDLEFLQLLNANDGPIGGGSLRSEIPDLTGPITFRGDLVKVKTGDLLILTATTNEQFKRALAQSGRTAQEVFSAPEDDIADQIASVDPTVVIGKIAEVGGPSVAASVLEEAKTNAVSVLNGYAPEAQRIIDKLREEILDESKSGTFKPVNVSSFVQEKPSLADGQTSKNGDHWTKTTKSGLRRGPGSKRFNPGKLKSNGNGTHL